MRTFEHRTQDTRIMDGVNRAANGLPRPGGGLTGLGWTTAQTWLSILSQIGLMIVLSRLISPLEFGVYAVAMAPVAIAATVAQLGLGPAVVRGMQDVGRLAGTGLAIGAVSSGLCLLIVLGIASHPAWLSADNDRVTELMAWLSLIVVAAPIHSISVGLLQHGRRFDSLAKIGIGALLVNAVLAIACALAGLGAWALAIGTLGYQLSMAAGLCAVARPALSFHRADALNLLQFSFGYVWLKLIDTAMSTLDRLIVFGAVGASGVGFYQRAMNIRSVAGPLALQPMDTFSYPRLSATLGDPGALRREFDQAKALALLFSAPLSIGIIVAAREWTPILFGKAWDPAGPLIQIMAVVLPFLALHRVSIVLARAAARHAWQIAIQLTTLVMSLLTLYLLVPISLQAATIGLSIVLIMRALPSFFLTASILKDSPVAEIRAALPALCLWAVGVGFGLAAKPALATITAGWVAALAAAVLASGAYLLMSSFLPHLLFSKTAAILIDKYRDQAMSRISKYSFSRG